MCKIEKRPSAASFQTWMYEGGGGGKRHKIYFIQSARVSYVAISRVKTVTSFVIEPMTYERIASLKSSSFLQYRLEEENRLTQQAVPALKQTIEFD